MTNKYLMAEENAEAVNELMTIARKLVNKETEDKIKSLSSLVEKQDAELQKYDNFYEIEREYKNKIAELEWEIEQAYSKGFDECLKQRLDKVIPMQKGYIITYEWVYKHDKCDKCDDDRLIHFYSPRGNELTETCECGEKTRNYIVSDATVDSWVFGYNEDKDIPSRYYKARVSYENETHFNSDRIWVYKDFKFSDELLSENSTSYFNYVFETKKDAQRYCDWLNKKVRKGQ